MNDKVILVNGGAKGIGVEEVKALVWEGARVIIGDIYHKEGEQLEKELGDNVRFIHVDATKPEDWENAVKAIGQEFGNIDVLINNSVSESFCSIENYTLMQFRQMLDANLIGHFNAIKAVVPSMKNNKGGSIINISNSIGTQSHPLSSGYGASKWAIRGLTKNLAIELEEYDIRVNSILIGNTNAFIADGDEHRVHISLKKGNEEKEIMDVILFLAGNDSSLITGTEILMGEKNTERRIIR